MNMADANLRLGCGALVCPTLLVLYPRPSSTISSTASVIEINQAKPARVRSTAEPFASCPVVQELEKALSCKYVASNAVTALQQVYQVSANRPGQKAKSLQAWARILLKPELGRVTEACQLLEQVALDTIQQGGNYSQAQSKRCFDCFSYVIFSELLFSCCQAPSQRGLFRPLSV